MRVSLCFLLLSVVAAYPQAGGIPVKDPLVISQCGTCHKADARGNLSRISWIRTTPEGWQEAIRRMVRLNGASLAPEDARQIVKSLSSSHGLAPEEARPVMYMAEHRIQEEQFATPWLRSACASCHVLGRPLQWRRTKEEWKLLVDLHIGLYPDSEGAAFRRNGPPQMGPNGPVPQPADQAIEYFGTNYGLETPEWTAWQARQRTPRLAGKWLITAHSPGRGEFVGEFQVTAGTTSDEFTTRVNLQPTQGGPVLQRAGRGLLYAGYSWRGRISGSPQGSAANAMPADMREVLWFSPDGSQAFGRWFWGGYDEFGFDVKLTRATGAPLLLSASPPRLKAGARAQLMRIVGDALAAQTAQADIDLGPGIAVKRIVSRTANELVLEVDVAETTAPGKRDLAFGNAVLTAATAVYDSIDAVKVLPETPMARLGGEGSPRPKGYQQFEAIAYHRGPDNKPNTEDDVTLGPLAVNWSVEEFVEAFDDNDKEFVGTLNTEGLFTPAIDGPNPQRRRMANNHGNVWVVATAKEEKDKSGKPLTGKSYLVVAPPLYIIWDRGVE